MRRASPCLLAFGLSLAAGICPSAIAQDTTTLGWLEHASIAPGDFRVDAKLDTGAKTSAIHAEILRGPSRPEDLAEDENGATIDGEQAEDQPETVVFQLSNEDGETMTLEREVVRYVRVKLRRAGFDRRPVVLLDLCLAGVRLSGEVNLADRSRFNYPLLIGRTMLADAGVIVDSRSTYTQENQCAEPEIRTELDEEEIVDEETDD